MEWSLGTFMIDLGKLTYQDSDWWRFTIWNEEILLWSFPFELWFGLALGLGFGLEFGLGFGLGFWLGFRLVFRVQTGVQARVRTRVWVRVRARVQFVFDYGWAFLQVF